MIVKALFLSAFRKIVAVAEVFHVKVSTYYKHLDDRTTFNLDPAEKFQQ